MVGDVIADCMRVVMEANAELVEKLWLMCCSFEELKVWVGNWKCRCKLCCWEFYLSAV
jgi:hypothetical protein